MSEPQPLPTRANFQNLTGHVFGKVTVLFYAGSHKRKYSLWHCRCECGREFDVVSSRLTLGQTTRCLHCFRHAPKPKRRSDFIDLSGQTFGRLTVTSLHHYHKTSNKRSGFWSCQCSCGESTVARGDSLKDGSIQSCGCLNVAPRHLEEPKPNTRTCRMCGKDLPLTTEFFHRHPNSPHGFILRCRECRNASNSRGGKKHRLKVRDLVLRHYGGDPPKCDCCGEPHQEFLSLDHINGGGRKHRAEVGEIYAWIVRNNFPSGFRILCHNCNFSFGKYGYCPHQVDKST